MEKFGIFELLDTLSALILPDGQPAVRPEEHTSEAPRAEDSAFAPPAYRGAPAPAVPPAPAPPPASSALHSFLEKHDSAVKRIDSSPDGTKK